MLNMESFVSEYWLLLLSAVLALWGWWCWRSRGVTFRSLFSRSQPESSSSSPDSLSTPSGETPTPNGQEHPTVLPLKGSTDPRSRPQTPSSAKWGAVLLILCCLGSCFAVVSMSFVLVQEAQQERVERAKERLDTVEHNRLVGEARKRQVVNEATLLLQQERAIQQAKELERRLQTILGDE